MATELTLIKRRFGETSRSDVWWLQPVLVFCGLTAFVIYTTWAAFQGEHYHHGPYLSPFYAPEIFGDSAHSWLGPKPIWWPTWLPFSPAFLILWAPAGFRLTCYYYRGAYYKAFWADPPSCAVGEPRNGYRGENAFPLILQNIHRFFLYFALIFVALLAYDVWNATQFDDGFGIGLGTIVLAINVFFLGGYTLGCHSLRHLVGGFMDRLSGTPIRRTVYDCVSCLNGHHMRWAWMRLFSVALSDVYVRLCSMGVLSDWRIL